MTILPSPELVHHRLPPPPHVGFMGRLIWKFLARCFSRVLSGFPRGRVFVSYLFLVRQFAKLQGVLL